MKRHLEVATVTLNSNVLVLSDLQYPIKITFSEPVSNIADITSIATIPEEEGQEAITFKTPLTLVEGNTYLLTTDNTIIASQICKGLEFKNNVLTDLYTISTPFRVVPSNLMPKEITNYNTLSYNSDAKFELQFTDGSIFEEFASAMIIRDSNKKTCKNEYQSNKLLVFCFNNQYDQSKTHEYTITFNNVNFPIDQSNALITTFTVQSPTLQLQKSFALSTSKRIKFTSTIQFTNVKLKSDNSFDHPINPKTPGTNEYYFDLTSESFGTLTFDAYISTDKITEITGIIYGNTFETCFKMSTLKLCNSKDKDIEISLTSNSGSIAITLLETQILKNDEDFSLIDTLSFNNDNKVSIPIAQQTQSMYIAFKEITDDSYFYKDSTLLSFTTITLPTKTTLYSSDTIEIENVLCSIEVKLNTNILDNETVISYDANKLTIILKNSGYTVNSENIFLFDTMEYKPIIKKGFDDVTFSLEAFDIKPSEDNTITITSTSETVLPNIANIVLTDMDGNNPITYYNPTSFETPKFSIISNNKLQFIIKLEWGVKWKLSKFVIDSNHEMSLTKDIIGIGLPISMTPDYTLIDNDTPAQGTTPISISILFDDVDTGNLYKTALSFDTEPLNCTPNTDAPKKLDCTISLGVTANSKKEYKLQIKNTDDTYKESGLLFTVYPFKFNSVCKTIMSAGSNAKIILTIIGGKAETFSSTNPAIALGTISDPDYTLTWTFSTVQTLISFVIIKNTIPVVVTYTIDVLVNKQIASATIFATGGSQDFEITFADKLEEKDFNKLYFYKKNESTLIQTERTKCTIKETPSNNIVECIGVELNSSLLQSGITVQIQSENHCTEVNTKYDITLSLNTITKIEPTKFKLKGTTNPSIVVTFSNNFNPTTDKLYLFNKDKESPTAISIVEADYTSTEASKTISIKSFTNISEEGFYYLALTETPIPSSGEGIHMYSSSLALLPLSRSATVDTTVTNFEISFVSNVYISRFKKITLQKENTIVDADDKISAEIKPNVPKTIILTSSKSLTLTDEKQYQIVIEDNAADPATITLPIEVYKSNPPTDLVSKVIVLDTNKNHKILVKIPEAITNKQAINSIVSSNDSEGKKFTFTVKTYPANDCATECQLELKPKSISEESTEYKRYTSLIFKDKGEIEMYTLTKNYLILQEQHLPIRIKTKAVTFEGDSVNFKVELSFNDASSIQTLFVEYKDEFDIKGEKGESCAINPITDTDTKIGVTCTLTAESTLKFSMSFMKQSFTTTETPIIVSCPKATYWDKDSVTCKPCSNMNGIWDDGKSACTSCSDTYQKLDNEECKDCSKITPNTYFDITATGLCAENCGENFVFDKKACFTECKTPNYTEGEKICVSKCSDGKGIEDGKQVCSDISIASIDGNIIADQTEQNFQIILNNKVLITAPIAFHLKKTSTSDSPITITCTITEPSPSNSFICTALSTAISDNTLKIFWFATDDIKDLVGKAITMTEKGDSITPKLYQIGVSSETNVIITYTEEFTSKVLYLINTDTKQQGKDISSRIKVSEDKKTVTIPIVVNNESLFTEEGFYILSTQQAPPSSPINPSTTKGIHVYSSPALKLPNGYKSVILSETNKEIEITFLDEVYLNRFKTISLEKKNAEPKTIVPTFKKDDTSKKIIVLSEISIATEEEFTIEFTEYIDVSEILSLTIDVYKSNPPKSLVNKLIILKEDNSHKFIVNFDDKVSKKEIIDKVLSSNDLTGNAFSFTATGFEDNELQKQLILTPDNEQKASLYGRFSQLLFIDKAGVVIYTLNEPYVIIEKSLLPGKIKTPTAIFDSSLKFKIIFETKEGKTVMFYKEYVEYKDDFVISGENNEKCTYDNPADDNFLMVKCTFTKDSTLVVKASLFKAALEPTLQVSCEAKQFFDKTSSLTCKSCQELPGTWDESSQMCINCKNINKVFDDKLKDCSTCQLVSPTKPYFNKADGTCIAKCGDIEKTYDGKNGKMCLDTCTPDYLNEEVNKCVDSCSNGYGIDLTEGNEKNCIKMSMTGVSGYLIKNQVDQSITITLNSKVLSTVPIKFYILEDNTATTKNALTCGLEGDSPSNKYLCTKLSKNVNINASKYTVHWEIALVTNPDENEQVITSKVGFVTSIIPNIFKTIQTPTETELKGKFTITFSSELAENISLYLINKDGSNKETILAKDIKLSTDKKSATITEAVINTLMITKSEGFYILSNKEDDTFLTPTTGKGIYIYALSLSLIDDYKSVKLVDPMGDIEIAFKNNVFINRFKKITLQKEGGQSQILSATMKTNDPKGIVLTKPLIDTITKYTLVFEDIVNDTKPKPLSMTLEVYDNYEPTNLNRPIIVIDSTIPRDIFITFKNEIINRNVIKSIITKSTPADAQEFILNIDTNYTEDPKLLKLIPADNQPTEGYDSFTSFDFLDIKKKVLFTYTEDYTIVSEKTIPTAISSKEISFNENEKFNITFTSPEAVLSRDYQDHFIIKGKNNEECTIDLINNNDKELTVSCAFNANSVLEVSVSFLGISLTDDGLIILSCQKETYYDKTDQTCKACSKMQGTWDSLDKKCKKCSDLNGYFETDKCELCSETGQIVQNGKCVDCPVDNKIFNYDTNKCIKDCNAGLIYKDKVCFTKCPSSPPEINLFQEEKTCVDKCSDGYGEIANVNQCQKLAIAKIEGGILANTANQDLKIIMNGANKSSTSISFELKSATGQSATTPNTITCNTDSEAILYTCTALKTHVSDGSYKIYWAVGTIKDAIGYSISVNKIILSEIDKSICKIGTDKSAKLTYTGTFENTYKIALYNVDTAKEIPIIEKDITALPVITMTFPADITEGLFKIKTTGANGNLIELSPLTILLYASGVTIGNDIVDIEQRSTMTVFNFDFSASVFKSRIESITYTSAGAGAKIEDITSFTINDKRLTINHSITFKESDDHTITIKDRAFPNSPLTITLTVIEKIYPSKAEYDRIYYYTSTSPSFIVTLPPVEEKYFDCSKEFSDIRTKEKGIKFLKSYNATTKKCILNLEKPNDSINWGYYTSIVFYDKYDDTISVIGHERETPLILVNSQSVPSSLKKSEILLAKETYVFDIEFNQEVYEEYLTYNKIVKKDDKIKSITYNGTTKKITITLVDKINPIPASVKISSFEKEIEIKLIVVECKPNEVYNPRSEVLCTACNKLYPDNSRPYLYNNECLRICPYGKIKDDKDENNKRCVDSCADINIIIKDHYVDTEEQICKNSCIEPKFIHHNAKKCYMKCPTQHNGLPLYIDNDKKECVSSCPPNTYVNEKNECIQKTNDIEKKCLNTNTEFYCIESCPPGTEIIDNKCRFPIPSADITESKCDGFCLNDGSCSFINKQRVCKCKDDYHGLKCDLKEEKAIVNEIKKTIDSLVKSIDNIVDVENAHTISSILNIGHIIKTDSKFIDLFIKDDSKDNNHILSIEDLMVTTSKTILLINLFYRKYYQHIIQIQRRNRSFT